MPADLEMTAYYARRASEYDRVYQKPERQADLARLRQDVSELLDGRHVYEVACGTGYWTAVFAPAARRVFATDFNEEVLTLARARALPAGRVEFAPGDAFAPVAPPFACDGAFAGFWWSHLRRSEVAGFLSTFFARLAPGARLVFIDNRYVEGSSTPLSRTDADGNTYQRRALDSGASHEVLKNFPAEAELRRHLAPHATDVTYTDYRYFWLVSGARR